MATESPSQVLRLADDDYHPESDSDSDNARDDSELDFEPQEVSDRRDQDYELERKRAKAGNRFQQAMSDIFAKYSKDFSNVADEIDLETGEVVIDNGHLQNMRFEGDVGAEEEEGVLLEDFVDTEEDEEEGVFLGDLIDGEEDEDEEGGVRLEESRVESDEEQWETEDEDCDVQEGEASPSTKLVKGNPLMSLFGGSELPPLSMQSWGFTGDVNAAEWSSLQRPKPRRRSEQTAPASAGYSRFDSIWAPESGFKGDWPDNRLRIGSKSLRSAADRRRSSRARRQTDFLGKISWLEALEQSEAKDFVVELQPPAILMEEHSSVHGSVDGNELPTPPESGDSEESLESMLDEGVLPNPQGGGELEHGFSGPQFAFGSFSYDFSDDEAPADFAKHAQISKKAPAPVGIGTASPETLPGESRPRGRGRPRKSLQTPIRDQTSANETGATSRLLDSSSVEPQPRRRGRPRKSSLLANEEHQSDRDPVKTVPSLIAHPNEEPQPRGRGRPRKSYPLTGEEYVQAEDADTTMPTFPYFSDDHHRPRQRGRPKKSIPAFEELDTQMSMIIPRLDDEPQRRARGRPRKWNPELEEDDTTIPTQLPRSDDEPQRRGRGRPRKSISGSGEHNITIPMPIPRPDDEPQRRGRGRPRKLAQAGAHEEGLSEVPDSQEEATRLDEGSLPTLVQVGELPKEIGRGRPSTSALEATHDMSELGDPPIAAHASNNGLRQEAEARKPMDTDSDLEAPVKQQAKRGRGRPRSQHHNHVVLEMLPPPPDIEEPTHGPEGAEGPFFSVSTTEQDKTLESLEPMHIDSQLPASPMQLAQPLSPNHTIADSASEPTSSALHTTLQATPSQKHKTSPTKPTTSHAIPPEPSPAKASPAPTTPEHTALRASKTSTFKRSPLRLTTIVANDEESSSDDELLRSDDLPRLFGSVSRLRPDNQATLKKRTLKDAGLRAEPARTPVKRLKENEVTGNVVTTPRGTVRTCGLDGFICDEDFCFFCCR